MELYEKGVCIERRWIVIGEEEEIIRECVMNSFASSITHSLIISELLLGRESSERKRMLLTRNRKVWCEVIY